MFDGLVDFVECESGMDSLEWQAKLTGKDWDYEEDDPGYNGPVPQALNAREIIELYKWWKEIRPKRIDPYDASGWNAYSEDKSIDELIETHTQEINDMMTMTRSVERDQEDEDTEMLIRLIKVRGAMWT